jgi:hypothetical protein
VVVPAVRLAIASVEATFVEVAASVVSDFAAVVVRPRRRRRLGEERVVVVAQRQGAQ